MESAEQLLLTLEASTPQASPSSENTSSRKLAEVVLVGQSIGCAVAIEMAARGYGSSCILISPFLSIRDMAETLFPFLKPALQVAPWLVKDRLDNARKAPSLGGNVPVLVLHGTEDEVVPVRQGRQLATLFQRATYLELADTGHNDIFDGDERMALMCDMLMRQIRNPGSVGSASGTSRTKISR
eukprot:FR735302.1.p1 GENE.FR735302.1~~FR735302.1.p1  ORF type:complete len:184 (+),score=18.92 FR735302.1:1-552(+)